MLFLNLLVALISRSDSDSMLSTESIWRRNQARAKVKSVVPEVR